MNNRLGWFIVILFLVSVTLTPNRAIAQTEPESTPTGYPLLATPVQPGEGYPLEDDPSDEGFQDQPYIAPTPATSQTEDSDLTTIGQEESVETTFSAAPISQSGIVRNRAILWAGFLITLVIFGIAAYGAMLMYTRRSR